MSKKVTGIVAYLTVIGWLISYCAGDREGAKVHINQNLVIIFLDIICWLTGSLGDKLLILSLLVRFALAVCWLLGFIYACLGENYEIPVIGKIHILK